MKWKFHLLTLLCMATIASLGLHFNLRKVEGKDPFIRYGAPFTVLIKWNMEYAPADLESSAMTPPRMGMSTREIWFKDSNGKLIDKFEIPSMEFDKVHTWAVIENLVFWLLMILGAGLGIERLSNTRYRKK